MVLLYIALGGALGSVLRYVIGGAVQRATHAGFPYGTLAVNILGCFLIGYLIKTFMNAEPSGATRALLVVGFCGGFTTFSAFSSETLGLFEAGAYSRAAVYIMLSLVLCLGATGGGFALARTPSHATHGR
jgi:fluoride exporter